MFNFKLVLFHLFLLQILFAPIRSEFNHESNEAKSTENTEKPKLNVLEIFASMGKAIQLVLNQNGLQITSTARHETGNGDAIKSNRASRENYKEQAEILRVEIAKRAGALQTIVSSAIELLKDKGDVMMRRVLENLNYRIELAKTRADKILKEPATSEMAIKALNTINQGLHSLNSLIQQILRRVNVRINLEMRDEPKKAITKELHSSTASVTSASPSSASSEASSASPSSPSSTSNPL